MVLEKLDIYMQNTKLDSYLLSSTKINIKWITDLNLEAKTIQPL